MRTLLALILLLFLYSMGAHSTARADNSTASAPASTEADELAKKLANPVAALISVPFQINFDDGYADGSSRWTLNIQPVIPFLLNAKWTLLSRTILPVIRDERDTGLGDTSASGSR